MTQILPPLDKTAAPYSKRAYPPMREGNALIDVTHVAFDWWEHLTLTLFSAGLIRALSAGKCQKRVF